MMWSPALPAWRQRQDQVLKALDIDAVTSDAGPAPEPDVRQHATAAVEGIDREADSVACLADLGREESGHSHSRWEPLQNFPNQCRFPRAGQPGDKKVFLQRIGSLSLTM